MLGAVIGGIIGSVYEFKGHKSRGFRSLAGVVVGTRGRRNGPKTRPVWIDTPMARTSRNA